eukprot:7642088-Alexandrium_andersonii.AAC.1
MGILGRHCGNKEQQIGMDCFITCSVLAEERLRDKLEDGYMTAEIYELKDECVRNKAAAQAKQGG